MPYPPKRTTSPVAVSYAIEAPFRVGGLVRGMPDSSYSRPRGPGIGPVRICRTVVAAKKEDGLGGRVVHGSRPLCVQAG